MTHFAGSIHSWYHVVSDVDQTVRDCQNCRKKGTTYCPQRHVKFCPATGTLESVAINIAGPFPKSRPGNQFVVFITDPYLKRTKSIPSAKLATPHVALFLINHWIMSYGIPGCLLPDIGAHSGIKFFSLL